jgi:hypothetical protein
MFMRRRRPLLGAAMIGGGVLLADAWVHPSDLVAAGLVTAADAERELIF